MQIRETDGEETHGLKKIMTIDGTDRIIMNIIVEDSDTGKNVNCLKTFLYTDDFTKIMGIIAKNITENQYWFDFNDDIKEDMKEKLAFEKKQVEEQLTWFTENTDKIIEWKLSCKSAEEWSELLDNKNLSEFQKGLVFGIIQGYTDAVQIIEENGKWKKLKDIEHMYG